VARDGVLTKAEALSDVAVRATGCGELHNFDLSLAEAGSPAPL